MTATVAPHFITSEELASIHADAEANPRVVGAHETVLTKMALVSEARDYLLSCDVGQRQVAQADIIRTVDDAAEWLQIFADNGEMSDAELAEARLGLAPFRTIMHPGRRAALFGQEMPPPMVPEVRKPVEPARVDRSSWWGVDLRKASAEPVVPTILQRSDGIPLLYPGRINWLSGEPEAGKSWLAFMAGKEALEDGKYVLVVDAEDGPSGFTSRMATLGVDVIEHQESGHFKYVNPTEGILPPRYVAATAATLDLYDLVDWSADLVVFDACTALMELDDLDPLSNKDVAKWLSHMVKPFARAGAAVLVIDHVTKSKEGRDRWALGAQNKLAAVDGAAYTYECIRPVGQAFGSDPVEGMGRLMLAKDRCGYLRGHAPREKVPPIADVALTAYPDGGMTIHIDAPGTGETTPHQSTIVAYLAVYDGATKSSLRGLGSSPAIDAATAALVASGHVAVTPKGNSHQHHLTAAGRDHWAETITEATGENK